MDSVDYLIIGGGIAGLSAAESIRNKDSSSSILLIDGEGRNLYSKVMLKEFLKGNVKEKDVYLKKSDFYKKNNIKFLRKVQVEFLNSKDYYVVLDNKRKIRFKKLLIATGSRANKLDAGSNGKVVCYLRSLGEAITLANKIKSAKEAIVIGGGFIGLEAVSIFKEHRIPTTLILRNRYFWHKLLGKEVNEFIHSLLARHNIKVKTGVTTVNISKTGKSSKILLSNGETIKSDLIIAGIGIVPNAGFLSGSGVYCDNGVVVNEFMETNVPGIYAAGDVANFYDRIFKCRHRLGNWANAFQQGKIAGLNMSGEKVAFQMVSSYFVSLSNINIAVDFIGKSDAAHADNIIDRKLSSRQFSRIFLKKNKVVGAVLVNNLKEKSAVMRLIRDKINVGKSIKDLSRGSIPLEKLF